jgi:biopolymer transport protein ExbD
MAGGGDPNDNPVAINVVPMVDVIFCLCVFFMCSFRFKQTEGKFDSWLPKDKGSSTPSSEMPVEIRVAMFWDAQKEKVVRQYGSRIVATDEELQGLIKGAHDDYVRNNKPDVPVIIDGDARVPWYEVVNVVNICKRLDIDKIEFALGQADKSGAK